MRFSIITPSLNQGSFLGECLRSVEAAAKRSGTTVEHLVMDGGSTDGSVEILQKQTFARWCSEPDKGQADAVNKGLAQSGGEILGYLCADDLLEPDALELVDAAFQAEPEVDFVYGDGYFLEGNSDWKRLKRPGEFSEARLRREGNPLIQPAVFWKRSVYERFGGFDERLRYCLDHEYWLRVSGQTRWRHIARPLATSRLHGDAKTSRALALAWAEAVEMQARYGMRVRPAIEALWMRVAGQYFYRFKRELLERVGKGKS